MSKSRKILLACTTHLVGIALGWQGWVLAHAPSGTNQETSRAAPSKRDAAGNGMAVEDVFEFVQGSDSVEKEKREVARAQAEFDRELAELDVPADIEAALSRELEEWVKDDQDHRKPSAKIMALMYHWAARDIAGMLKWAESGAAAQEAIMWHSFPVYEKLSKDKGPEALAAGLNGKFAAFSAHAMAQALGTTGDIDRALALKSSLSKAQWEMLRDRFAHTWPIERKDDIAKLAIAENQPELLLQFVGIKGSEGARWLSQMLADGSLDASFAEQLSKNQVWDELAKSGSVLPLNERIDRLRRSGDADRDVVGEIAQSDVTQLLK